MHDTGQADCQQFSGKAFNKCSMTRKSLGRLEAFVTKGSRSSFSCDTWLGSRSHDSRRNIGVSCLKILVADDSPVYRKLVEQALSQEDCTVLFTKNGRQAIDLFAEHRWAIL